MRNFSAQTHSTLAAAVLAGALLLMPVLAGAETPVELMQQGQIDSVNPPDLVINDRPYKLAGNVSIRLQGRSVNSASLSKDQTIAFATGLTEADNRIITEIVIAPGR